MSLEQPLIKVGSIKKRYLFKLFASFFGVAAGFLTLSAVTRALGPESFGSYNFLTVFFVSIFAFVDLCSSKFFYTKLSQKQNNRSLVLYYAYFVSIIFIIITAALVASFLTLFYKMIWPGQGMLFIVLAAGYGILNWVSQILNKISDAVGLTITAEIAVIFQKIFSVVMLLMFFVFGQLNLFSYFYLQCMFLFLLGALLFWIIQSRVKLFNWKTQLGINMAGQYTKEFYNYSHPVLIFGIFGLFETIFDRWVLQLFAGGEQQGFYGLAFYLIAFSILFTRAIEPLLARQFSIDYAKNDLLKIKRLFRKYVPLMYAITAYFACFSVVQSPKIITFFAGASYMPAILPLAIIAFYPMHQTYGQLNASVLFAMGKTSLYRNIGVFFTLIGIPLTLFLIAPSSFGGLGSGATGLAIKMVIIQFFGVNLELYFISKMLNLGFIKYLAHQLLVAFLFLVVAAFSAFGMDYMSVYLGNVVLSFITAGIAYTAIIILILFKFPKIFGITQQDVLSIIKKTQNFMSYLGRIDKEMVGV